MSFGRFHVTHAIALSAAIGMAGCSTAPPNDQLNLTTAVSTSRVGTAAGYFLVQGAILTKYDQCGGAGGWLGQPTSNEKSGPNGGRLSEFQGGSIYWTPTTGAHPVSGQILWAWNTDGGPGGPMGYPRSDQRSIPGGTEASFEHGTISFVDGHAQVHEIRP